MHVAFLVPAAPGHTYPALPVVEELVRRGHRVSMTTSGEMVATARASGAETVTLPDEPPTARTSGPQLSGTEFTAEELAAMLEGLLAGVRACFPLLAEHFRADPPDVVCFDQVDPTGRMLADKLSVPSATLVPNLAADENHAFSETFLPESFDFRNPRLLRLFADMREFAAEQQLDGFPDPMSEVLAERNIVLVPREFQPNGSGFDERFFFVGPSLGRRAHLDSWAPADPDKRLAYVSLGTAFNDRPEFFRTCLEAFRDGSWQVAMSVGDQVGQDELTDVPPNVEVRAHFPQPAVLRHADVFVTHAGMNSTMEALCLGVPTVGVPQVAEQKTNALRTRELGLGRHLDRDDLTAAALREAVDRVAEDDDVRANLDRMREVIRESGGASAAADVLERS